MVNNIVSCLSDAACSIEAAMEECESGSPERVHMSVVLRLVEKMIECEVNGTWPEPNADEPQMDDSQEIPDQVTIAALATLKTIQHCQVVMELILKDLCTSTKNKAT